MPGQKQDQSPSQAENSAVEQKSDDDIFNLFDDDLAIEWAEKTAIGNPVVLECCLKSRPSKDQWEGLPWNEEGVAKHGNKDQGRYSMLLGNNAIYSYGKGERARHLVAKRKPDWFKSYERAVRGWAELGALPNNSRQWELALVNWYYGGGNIPPHSDNEVEIDQTVPIVSHSMGDPVQFCFQQNGAKKAIKVETKEDVVLVMPAGSQSHSRHWTEASSGQPGWRINVTWRAYTRQVSACSADGGASPAEIPVEPTPQPETLSPVAATVTEQGDEPTRPEVLAEPSVSGPEDPARSPTPITLGDFVPSEVECPDEGKPTTPNDGINSRGPPKSSEASNSETKQEEKPSDPFAVKIPKLATVANGSRYKTAAVGYTDDSTHKPVLPEGWLEDLRQYVRSKCTGMTCNGTSQMYITRKAQEFFEGFDLHASGVANKKEFNDAWMSVVCDAHGDLLLRDAEKSMAVAAHHLPRWQKVNTWLKSSVLETGGMPWWMGAAFVGASVGVTCWAVHYRIRCVERVWDYIFRPLENQGLWRPMKGNPGRLRMAWVAIAGPGGRGGFAVKPTTHSRFWSLLGAFGVETTVRGIMGVEPVPNFEVPTEYKLPETAIAGLTSLAGSLYILSGFRTTQTSITPNPNSVARSSRA